MSKPVNIKLSMGGTPIFLIFLILKLTGTVTWSWWMVTLPLWLPFAIFFGFMAMVTIIALIASFLQ